MNRHKKVNAVAVRNSQGIKFNWSEELICRERRPRRSMNCPFNLISEVISSVKPRKMFVEHLHSCKGETKRKGAKKKTAVKVGISPPSFSFPLCTPLPYLSPSLPTFAFLW
jgi:hypothetical protein